MKGNRTTLQATVLLAVLLFALNAWSSPLAYITNSGDNTVSVIDLITNSVVGTVSLGSLPVAVAVNPAGSQVYVATWQVSDKPGCVGSCGSSGSVAVIDMRTNTVVAATSLGSYVTEGLAVNPAGTRVYVTASFSDNPTADMVSVIDTSTHQVVAAIPMAGDIGGVVVNPAGTYAYVTILENDTVAAIDTSTNSVVATVQVGTGPYGITIAGTYIYVTNSGSNTVSVIDTGTNSVVATVPVGNNPGNIVIAGTNIYVTNSGSNTVSVIDTGTNSVAATVPVGNNPGDLVIAGTNIYVTNSGSNTVSVIDTGTNSVVATVPVGNSPGDLVIAGTRIYVTNSGSNTVSVIDTGTNTVVATVPVGNSPGDIVVGSSTGDFSDVPSSFWAYVYIQAIYNSGMTVGCGSGNYCPSEDAARDQMAAFIIRALYGENFTYTPTPYFSDVPATDNFFKYIQKLKDLNITTLSGAYLPSEDVTRAQMAACIVRATQIKAGQDPENFTYTTNPYFTDVPATDTYFKYIQKLKDLNITISSGTYLPSEDVTRDQLAAFLARAFLGMR